jgi:acetyl-CoA carboxylase biotin carboxylase subunit
MPESLRKVLIANRGEIAVRVIRACRDMGIRTVAVYSEADRNGLHVRLADEAYPIGPPAPAESYLNIPKLIEVIKRSGSDAVHPGYGFLSENATFAEEAEKAGARFIGPTASAMKSMGNKIEARKIMKAAGVPVVPGSDEGVESAEEIEKIAGEIGYPILIKAAAGGGGRGMRVVRKKAEIEEAFQACRSEASTSFGDASVYVEKYSDHVRHIEVQILMDGQGNAIHLGERECSIQRRHQKLIEEAPSVLLTAEQREEIGSAAVRACRAINYRSAGTVEFLADNEGNFFFMEVNARIQVEHPITELVTGIDLVKAQLRIAAGEPLGIAQKDVKIQGSAIECRICAEDPDRNFLPSPGRVEFLRVPGGPGVRDDSGVYEGYEMPIHYDSMVSKLIVWGATREEAIARMRRALDEYVLEGFPTTISLHKRVMDDPEFQAGRLHTRFLMEMEKRPPKPLEDSEPLEDLASILVALTANAPAVRNGRQVNPQKPASIWKTAGRRRQLEERL